MFGLDSRRRPRRWPWAAAPLWLAGLALIGLACSPSPTDGPAAPPNLIHLADELEGAVVESGSAPEVASRPLEWSFGDLPPGWQTISAATFPWLSQAEVTASESALEVTLGRVPQPRGPLRMGGLWTELDGALAFDDWDTLLVRARSRDRFAGVTVAYNLDQEHAIPSFMRFFTSPDEAPPVFNDGSVQTYAIPIKPPEEGEAPAQLTSIAVLFAAPGEASLELLSISLVPRGAAYLDSVGSRAVARDGGTRTTLFAHAPARLTYPVRVPPGGRLDFGLTVERGEAVTYRIATREGEASEVRFQATVDDPESWLQSSIDLSELAGRSVDLVLEASSDRPGAVAFWGAPILAGQALDPRPNVIFYVIDGGDANLMSLYDYERPTTPYLETLAEQGVVFTRAFANATWTQPSTASFMTGLHHSVLGGLRRGVHSTAVPPEATTMGEYFRRAGFQTASFTANPNAGRMIGLDRGMDLMRDVETEHHSTSSQDLHEQYWAFRENYPGGPTWVHFQTTDVHEPNQPTAPYAGRFVAPEQVENLAAWGQRIWQVAGPVFGSTSVDEFYRIALERAGIDRQQYFETRKGLYDETMLHQDEQLRRLVDQLVEAGEWEDTLLVIGADHGHPAGTFARFGRGLFEPQPDPWQGAMFDAYATRVPLMVIWPGQIEGGRRIDTPVSMIDVLPTLLELAGLPAPEVSQGRSLVPLLRGETTETPPVILDEFRVDEATGEMVGNLEIIDGRWGASLEIAPVADGASPELGRHAVPAGGRWGAVHPYFSEVPRLLLYDLEADPFARKAVNDEHPEKVRHYTRLLLQQWEAHRALAGQFGEAADVPLTPEQLEQLRALGYIR